MSERRKAAGFSQSVLDTGKLRQEELQKAHQARKRKRRMETTYQREVLRWFTGCAAGAGKVWLAVKKKFLKKRHC